MKKVKHLQTKKFINVDDLFSCVRTVDNVDYVLGVLDDCKEVVKISVADLAAQIEDLGA